VLSADLLSPITIDETVASADQLLSIPQEWIMDADDTEEYFVSYQPLPPGNVPAPAPAVPSSSDENRVMVQVPPSSNILGTQYFDEQMSPAVDRRLSLVLQLDSSTDTTISSRDDTATVLPDVFNVSGPMGPPLTIQQEIDDLCNPLTHIVFSYGAILPTCLAFRVPRSLKEAKTLPDWPEWKLAHEKEFNAIEAQGTYIWVPKPPKTHIHRCHELFDIKTDNFGNPLKRKCRLVLQGNTQKYGESYFDVYAPVTTPEAIRILFAVTTQRDWGLRQFDFSTAYLNAPLEEEIYAYPPVGVEDPEGLDRIWRLIKSFMVLNKVHAIGILC
jgi:hypothetical protein